MFPAEKSAAISVRIALKKLSTLTGLSVRFAGDIHLTARFMLPVFLPGR